MRRQKGFTLIELLIVVAIIGILAAIAIPNFLEAQVRAKLAKNYSEFRTVGLALEMYSIDQNDYPLDFYSPPTEYSLVVLTTPISYMSSLPANPFGSRGGAAIADWYDYGHGDPETWLPWFIPWRDRGLNYFLLSQGPNGTYEWGNASTEPWTQDDMAIVLATNRESNGHLAKLYDASNGTISSGDIWMTNIKIHNLK